MNLASRVASQGIKVGVVVPIYNVEKYLVECLDSVVSQTYSNIEVLLVNDGSTDKNSFNIAKSYTAKYANFTLIDKPNLGLSSARNAGIEYFSNEYTLQYDKALSESESAKLREYLWNLDSKANIESTNASKDASPIGLSYDDKPSLQTYKVIGNNPYNIKAIYANIESKRDSKENIESNALEIPQIDYIIFLDSDDYWRSDCIELCVKAALQSKLDIAKLDSKKTPQRAEIIWFDWEYFYDGVEPPKNKWKSWQELYKIKNDTIMTRTEWLQQSVECKPEFFAFAWMAMIDFSYLKRIRLKFIDRIMNEDVIFETLLFFQAHYIYALNAKLYVYRIRPNSITDYSAKNATNIPPYLQELLSHFSGNERNTKEYHKGRSWLVMLEEMELFLRPYGDSSDVELLKRAFYPKFCEMISQLASFPEDPLRLLPRMQIIKPYVTRYGVRLKRVRRLALNRPKMYKILTPFVVMYRFIKDMERKIRRKAKG